MKVFIFKKRKFLLNLLISIIIVFILFSIYVPCKPLAVELTYNSYILGDFMDKAKNLTHNTEKIAYLTFDDGPTTSVTPRILEILKKEDIKATFFVIGKSVEAHPEIVEQAYLDGHYIANHGYDHDNYTMYKSKESFIDEIKKTDSAIGKAIGIENYCSYIFRFPNGFMSSIYKTKKEEAVTLLLDMNYIYIDWNCLNKDSEKKCTSAQLLENLKQSSKDKNTLVILMHDTKDVNDSFIILEESISYLKSQGYAFKNFYDLFD